MTKRDRTMLLLIGGLTLLAVALEVMAPRPVDWTPSFEGDDARPYGSRVVREVLPELRPGSEVVSVDAPPYLALRQSRPDAYLVVTDTFEPDDEEAERFLQYVAGGGTLFVAASGYDGLFADTLGLETEEYPFWDSSDSLRLNLTNPALRADEGYRYLQGTVAHAFALDSDSVAATVLGTNSAGAPTYVRIPFGVGELLLSSTPLAFTNYNALAGEGAGYVYRAWAYLPEGTLWWDEYLKPTRLASTTPLRFVLATPPLRWALGVALVGLLLFLTFEAKRRQRVIPIVRPPENASVEFVETVGRLYFLRGDHAQLARKKAEHLRAYVREHLRLPTNRIDDALLRRVAERSGMPEPDVRALFEQAARLERQERVTEAELGRFSERVGAFRSRADGRRTKVERP